MISYSGNSIFFRCLFKKKKRYPLLLGVFFTFLDEVLCQKKIHERRYLSKNSSFFIKHKLVFSKLCFSEFWHQGFDFCCSCISVSDTGYQSSLLLAVVIYKHWSVPKDYDFFFFFFLLAFNLKGTTLMGLN